MKLWGGRFTKATDKSVEEFNASIQFDCRMYAEDICGSIAHATMLAKQGIISQEDKDAIVKGLKAIFQQIEDGNFDFSVELEDIHMNIERPSARRENGSTRAVPATIRWLLISASTCVTRLRRLYGTWISCRTRSCFRRNKTWA